MVHSIEISDAEKIDLLYRCLRIRAVEEGIAAHYSEQEMRCPTHLSIGQELVGAATGMILGDKDLAVSTHRAHAHYLGKGGNLKAMLAEIYGKADGCAKGRGGSMHLIDRSVGFEGSTAIVGNSVPVGVGLALSLKLDRSENIVCIFIGDAVFETGVFYESMNFAATQKLPVLFMCENNLYSVYSPLSVRQPENRNNFNIATSMGLKSATADGMDCLGTYQSITEITDYVRDGNGPALLEVSAYRWREHCGPNYDNDIGYRSVEEYEDWRAKDGILKLQKMLLEKNILSEDRLEKLLQEINSEIDEAFEHAKSSPYPDPATAGDYEYAEHTQ